MAATLVTRIIEIDAGHRIHEHGGKCSSIHGHRYKIEAHLSGDLHTSGLEAGMVIDFGRIKESMLRVIDEPCDHAMILSVEDPLLETFVLGTGTVKDSVEFAGYWSSEYDNESVTAENTKVYVIKGKPTAEVLAKHWYERLGDDIEALTSECLLQGVTVWETPNCSATYGEIG